MGTVNFLSRCNEDYIVMSDCDVICNIDLADVMAKHEESGADITFVTKKDELVGVGKTEQLTLIKADESGRVTDVASGKYDEDYQLYLNIMVMKRQYLLNVVENAISHGHHSFLHDIIMHNVETANYRVYEYDGFYAHIGSMASYFECTMKLLEADARERLFGIKHRPVLTKIRNSAPTRYCEGAKVLNSVVAEGCVIEGTVENSIIFRGVKVGKGAVVKNSILFQDTYVCEGAQLNCVITDKNATIKDGRNLSGHESMPFYIGKNTSV
jgi:glucose-1-phosphate adenylyltransferase